MQTPDDVVRSQLLTFSLRPVAELRGTRCGTRRGAAPADRSACVGRRDGLAGARRGRCRRPRTRRPTCSSRAIRRGRRRPHSRCSPERSRPPASRAAELDDAVAVLVATGLASSNGDARRTMEQNAYSVNGVRLTANDQLSGQKLLHGRYLLLRRGKKLHHLVEIYFLTEVARRVGSVNLTIRFTEAIATGKAQEPTPRTATAQRRAHSELRLLENGREDRTPVRAVRSAPLGVLRETVCQFRCRHPAGSNTDTGRSSDASSLLLSRTRRTRSHTAGRFTHTDIPSGEVLI